MHRKTKTHLPYLKSDPARWEFQYLEDLSMAYWYSQVLFSAVEVDLFSHIEQGASTPAALAAATGCQMAALARVVAVLERLDLVHRTPQGLANSQLARRFLVPGQPDYMGDFIHYRRYMQTGWSALTPTLAGAARPVDTSESSAPNDYEARNFSYVRAMDRLARLKAREIAACLNMHGWRGPILDIGGGAGAIARQLLLAKRAVGQPAAATLFDLAEVIRAARQLYPRSEDWQGIELLAGDFRHYALERAETFGLVVMSNFLHAYDPETARDLLVKAAALTAPDGVLLIHDYFPDRMTRRPHKGALYDVNMLLNTYNGACHRAADIQAWLATAGMAHGRVVDLPSDSSMIVAGAFAGTAAVLSNAARKHAPLETWREVALTLGFSKAELLPADKIMTGRWTREKCRFGCGAYGKNRMCPPAGIDHATMTQMLAEYRWALVVAGTPPGREFHERLLALEKKAFLAGFHKALAFGAGPCPVCERCPDDGGCRHPDRARPSMEGSGIDVYATANRAGIRIAPVPVPDRYVKYMGMVLLT